MAGLTLHPFNEALSAVDKYHTTATYNDSKFLMMGLFATMLAPWSAAGPVAGGLYVAQNTREYYLVRRPLDYIRQEVKEDKKKWGNWIRFSEVVMSLEAVAATLFLGLAAFSKEDSGTWLRWGGASLVLCGAHMATHTTTASVYADNKEDKCQDLIDAYNDSWFTRLTLSGILV